MAPMLHLTILLTIIGILYWAYKDGQAPYFKKLFASIQWIQIISLYTWYVTQTFDWSISLPFYHCRMAMLAILCLPDRNRHKPYFALLGLVGGILSFIYPIMDTYAWPHLTQFSFVIGHLALIGNCAAYLFWSQAIFKISRRGLVSFVLGMNLFILLINQVTGGDYGFMRKLPLFATTNLLVNFLMVSAFLILLMGTMGQVFLRLKQRQAPLIFQARKRD